jgi:hypothetical protein
VPAAAPTAEHEALVTHSEQAAPRWRGAAEVLQHAEPPVYGELSSQMADRLEAAAESGLSASRRQELVHEERQLVEHLKRRYEGIPELQRHVSHLEDSLAEIEASITTVVASPAPRDTLRDE